MLFQCASFCDDAEATGVVGGLSGTSFSERSPSVHWTFLISIVAVAVVLYATLQDRRAPKKLWWWWVGVPLVLAPPLTLGLLRFVNAQAPERQAEALQLVQYGLWSAGFVAIMGALLLTFGKAGDGRAVAWRGPIAALVGMIVAGIVSPMAAAWLAPLVVFAVCARAIPTGSSVRSRRRTLASLGLAAVFCTNIGLLLDHQVASLRGRADQMFNGASVSLTDPGLTMVVGDVVSILFVVGVVLGIGLAGTIVAK